MSGAGSSRTPPRAVAFARGAALAMLASLVLAACGSGDLLVGDDSRDAASPPGPAPFDAGPSPTDATTDASDSAVDAPIDASTDATCPTLSPPGPTFCDGGPFAPRYRADGCVTGYVCTPASCTDGGGTCVALTPTACASGHLGDAAKYSCGGGLGVACCLPGPGP